MVAEVNILASPVTNVHQSSLASGSDCGLARGAGIRELSDSVQRCIACLKLIEGFISTKDVLINYYCGHANIEKSCLGRLRENEATWNG